MKKIFLTLTALSSLFVTNSMATTNYEQEQVIKKLNCRVKAELQFMGREVFSSKYSELYRAIEIIYDANGYTNLSSPFFWSKVVSSDSKLSAIIEMENACYKLSSPFFWSKVVSSDSKLSAIIEMENACYKLTYPYTFDESGKKYTKSRVSIIKSENPEIDSITKEGLKLYMSRAVPELEKTEKGRIFAARKFCNKLVADNIECEETSVIECVDGKPGEKNEK